MRREHEIIKFKKHIYVLRTFQIRPISYFKNK